MALTDERTLLVNLFAEPKLVKAMILAPQEFEDLIYRNVYRAFRAIPASAMSHQAVVNWLQSHHSSKAVAEFTLMAKDAPISTTVEKILYYQSAIREAHLKKRLLDWLPSVQQRAQTDSFGFDDASKALMKRIGDLTRLKMATTESTFDAVRARANQQTVRDSWDTGIVHLDLATSGMARGEVWILNAPYKGFKTRSALNIVMNALQAKDPLDPSGQTMKPRSVLYITYDGLDVDLYRSLMGVYADLPPNCFTGPFDKAAYRKLVDEETRGQLGAMEGYRIPRKLENHPTTTPVNYQQRTYSELEVIAQVKEANAWSNVPLRILDGRYPIRDLDSLHALIIADKLRFNTDLIVFDYVQAMAPSREYEQLAAVADFCQRIAVEQDVCVLEISQMSNEDIKRGPESRMLGTKGSGDFGATCDVGIEIVVKPDAPDPFQISYVLKVARRAPRLVDQGWMNPMSGQWTSDWTLMSYRNWLSTTTGAASGTAKKSP